MSNEPTLEVLDIWCHKELPEVQVESQFTTKTSNVVLQMADIADDSLQFHNLKKILLVMHKTLCFRKITIALTPDQALPANQDTSMPT